MDWDNSHLHQFMINDQYYAPADEWSGEYDNDYKGVKLKNVLSVEGAKISYEYDFGDSWEHEIKLEKIKEKEDIFYPRCIKGKRASPPEDCGGIWGYADLVEAMKTKKGEVYEELKEWVNDDSDPEYFH